MFSPVSFLMLEVIYALLVMRVVSFITNYYKTAFSFISSASILLKYPLRAARPIG